MYTIRTFTKNGRHFPPTQGVYQVAYLRDALFHARQCMEDNEQWIGLFDSEGQCKGIWLDEARPMDDGEGGMTLGAPAYVLYRPGDLPAGLWNNYVANFKGV